MLLQVFYHLGDLDDALAYALGAGSLFDVGSASEYVQTILGEHCLHNAPGWHSCRARRCASACFVVRWFVDAGSLHRRQARMHVPPAKAVLIRSLCVTSTSLCPLYCLSAFCALSYLHSVSALLPPWAAARCIDTYVEERVAEAEGRHEGETGIDSRLVAVVERLFDRCLADRQYEQAVGIALESRRLDQLERAISSSPGELTRRGCIIAAPPPGRRRGEPSAGCPLDALLLLGCPYRSANDRHRRVCRAVLARSDARRCFALQPAPAGLCVSLLCVAAPSPFRA